MTKDCIAECEETRAVLWHRRMAYLSCGGRAHAFDMSALSEGMTPPGTLRQEPNTTTSCAKANDGPGQQQG